MKTAISIPDELFERAERMARRSGTSRSELYAQALDAYLQARDDPTQDPVTAKLDELAGTSVLAPLDLAGKALVDSGLWEW